MCLVMPVARLIIERGYALGGSAAIERLVAGIGRISLNHQLCDFSIANDQILQGRLHSRGHGAVSLHGQIWPAGCWIDEDAVTFKQLPQRQILQLRDRHEPGKPVSDYIQLGGLSTVRTKRMTTFQVGSECWLRIWFDPDDMVGEPFAGLLERLDVPPAALAA